MPHRQTIGLVAHDNRKRDLIEWVEFNARVLLPHRLICTGTTGKLVREALAAKREDNPALLPFELDVTLLKSGPLGGDQQLGAMIAEGGIDLLVFLWDPMQQQPHDVDVKALLRISVLYNLPTACNRATADFLVSSPLLEGAYKRAESDYESYLSRDLSRR